MGVKGEIIWHGACITLWCRDRVMMSPLDGSQILCQGLCNVGLRDVSAVRGGAAISVGGERAFHLF